MKIDEYFKVRKELFATVSYEEDFAGPAVVDLTDHYWKAVPNGLFVTEITYARKLEYLGAGPQFESCKTGILYRGEEGVMLLTKFAYFFDPEKEVK